MPTASTIVSVIFTTFRLHGQHRIGEEVTEELHALQCATLAGGAGDSSEVIAPCLLHDFGRLLICAGGKPPDRETDVRPGLVGAHRLAAWFDPEVVEPIRLQAEAMRQRWLANRPAAPGRGGRPGSTLRRSPRPSAEVGQDGLPGRSRGSSGARSRRPAGQDNQRAVAGPGSALLEAKIP